MQSEVSTVQKIEKTEINIPNDPVVDGVQPQVEHRFNGNRFQRRSMSRKIAQIVAKQDGRTWHGDKRNQFPTKGISSQVTAFHPTNIQGLGRTEKVRREIWLETERVRAEELAKAKKKEELALAKKEAKKAKIKDTVSSDTIVTPFEVVEEKV
jgi:hypothetical protein